MRSEKLKKEILRISEGILSTVVDIVLWEVMYIGEAATTFSRDTWKPVVAANRFLDNVNYETIKRAIENARKNGWIKRTRKKRAWPEITQAGKRRLVSIIPQYDTKRVWDERLYLVTYDIPETRKKERELLREYIKRMGAGMIQESVWLTPYNPHELLKEFIDERKLEGTIIVSDIGKDGSVGEEDIKDLVIRVYKLHDINRDYKKFLDTFGNAKEFFFEVAFVYYKVLKKDPQLPFELLPSDWMGEKAHKLFQQFQSKLNT